MDEYREKILVKATAFQKAAKKLQDPAFMHDVILMKYLAESKFGNDVVDWIDDIERLEKTGRKRDTTWALGGGKKERRR
ncbi:hypothetical protein C0991_004615, partial [Blastosporella zonata]